MAINSRWEDALHFGPNGASFSEYWAERLKQDRNILVITGWGWDPRMTILSRTLQGFGGSGLRDFHLICYKPSRSYRSPSKEFLDKNNDDFEKIIIGWGTKQEIEVITRKEGNIYCGDHAIMNIYRKYDFGKYSDIIIDISALPKSIYFTLLLILVNRYDREYPKMNMHVIACQDVELDTQINETADDTRVLQGFKHNFTLVSKQQLTRIWVPVLEKNYSTSLRKLYNEIIPKDIYPILPFPSRNPRTDDDLLIEYRSIFVDEWRVDPMNIIYAVEDDPLDVYRSLRNLLHKQTEALSPLGGVSVTVSALSSKLSSIGAFMAAFEGKLSVVHAIGRHVPPDDLSNPRYWSEVSMGRFQSNLHSVWLTGEPFEE